MIGMNNNSTNSFDGITEEQLALIKSKIRDVPGGDAACGLLRAGMRFGEVLAVLKSDAFVEARELLADMLLSQALKDHEARQLASLSSEVPAPIGGAGESSVDIFLNQCKARLSELKDSADK